MATAQAASASPTHRDSSPATTPPPYPSAARIADSACFPQYTASLKCLEANQDKSKCQQQFDEYKQCKKKEADSHSAIIFCCPLRMILPMFGTSPYCLEIPVVSCLPKINMSDYALHVPSMIMGEPTFVEILQLKDD